MFTKKGYELMKSDFALRLRQIRIKAGLSQKDFAEIIGVPEGTYKSWEHGIALPNYKNRDVICKEYPELLHLWEREKTSEI